VTFFVRKAFATGRLRFGVERRSSVEEIDRDAVLSTGPAGEFVRRRSRGFYFAAPRPIGGVDLDKPSALESTTFFDSLKPDGTTRGWIMLAMIIFGLLLVLLGISVIATQDEKAPGVVELIFGLILIATPIILTAAERGKIRQREERERQARLEADTKRREVLAAYLAAIENLRKQRDDAAMMEVSRQRQNLDLPYEAWAPFARRATLDIAFEALSRFTPQQGADVAAAIDRAGVATGLLPGDIAAVKQEMVATAVWHILADDRLGEVQSRVITDLQKAMNLKDSDLPLEDHAARQFAQLRGLTPDGLEKQSCSIALNFGESCYLGRRATAIQTKVVKEEEGPVERLIPGANFSLWVTSRRIIVEGRKRVDIPLPKIDDIEVDVDAGTMMIRTAKPLKPLIVRVDDPIYTAGIIELALDAEPRPRSFA
jgi:hypothetical protein